MDDFLDVPQNWIVVEDQWNFFFCWLDLSPQKFGSWYTKSFVELFIDKLRWIILRFQIRFVFLTSIL